MTTARQAFSAVRDLQVELLRLRGRDAEADEVARRVFAPVGSCQSVQPGSMNRCHDEQGHTGFHWLREGDYSATWPELTKQPWFNECHAVALEREAIAAFADSYADYRADMLPGADVPTMLRTFAQSIRNGDHWKDRP